MRPTAKEWWAAAAVFVVLTIAMTWPFAARVRIVDAGDSAFFVWAVSWPFHALRTDPAMLPHGNFYAPSTHTFFMDEPVLGTSLLVLPLTFLTQDAILLFNVARLLTWVLTGLFTWRFARDVGMGHAAALATGAFFAFSPIRVDQLAHLSTLGTQWIPLVYLFGRRFCLQPNVLDAARTGLFFALSFLACGYHGLFFAALLPLSLLPLLGKERVAPALKLAPVALATAAFFLYPLYRFTVAALQPLEFVRSSEDTLKYSASLQTFIAASRFNRTWGDWTESFRGDPSNLFAGVVVLSLAVWAVIRARALKDRRARRLVMMAAVLAIGAALLALGPEIRLGDRSLFAGPYALLKAIAPVFSNVRATSRAGIFFAFGLALLAGHALASSRRSARMSLIALALFLFEARIAPIPTPSVTNVVDSREPTPPVYEWLAAQPKGAIVAEFPARSAADYSRPSFHDSIYMVRSTTHWQRLVNGFAGAETPMIRRFRATAPSFPDEASLATLQDAGTRFVVVHFRGYGPNQRERLAADLAAASALREVTRFENAARADVDVDVVYELVR